MCIYLGAGLGAPNRVRVKRVKSENNQQPSTLTSKTKQIKTKNKLSKEIHSTHKQQKEALLMYDITISSSALPWASHVMCFIKIILCKNKDLSVIL